MKKTYVKDNKKDLFGVMLAPCPTIKPVSIGIMGKTHGVKDNNTPASKKSNIF